MAEAADSKRRFRRISAAGIFFQGGAATVDTSTIVAALVHGLTGSALAVGAAAAIARFGWLFPQLFVAYYAQQRTRRLLFYSVGAFGRAACLAMLAGLLWHVTAPASVLAVVLFFAIWTVYAFVSGIVAVPYNDIVARSIPSGERSRMLALRFFGGGLLALGVAAAANQILAALPFPGGYGALLALGAALLLCSAVSFISAGEPAAPAEASVAAGFAKFAQRGLDTFHHDRRFRLFVFSQWLGGATAMALPFYILQANSSAAGVAFLLAAQTAGALLSNPFWGWWGDRRGKRDLLVLVAAFGAAPPALALAYIAAGGGWGEAALAYFSIVFLLLGAAGNGSTIAQLGYLMEISPDDRRPAYSGYFNMLVAPAALLPLAGGAAADAGPVAAVFAASLAAAALQFAILRRLHAVPGGEQS